MESPPSTSTTTSTTAKQDNMPSSQNPTVDNKKSNTDPTLPIPNPAHSPVFQQYVTDAAKIIASSHLTRNMFIVEVFKKCSEIALWEKRTGKTSPELLPTSPVPTREPLYTSDSYSSDVQHITPEGDEVLNRFIKKYSMPKISNPVSGSTSTVTASSAAEYMSPKTSTSGLTNTVTVSSNLGEPTTTTTTCNPTEGSTPHVEWRKTTRMAAENYNTSGSMNEKKSWAGPTKPGFNFICTCWHGRRPNQGTTDPVQWNKDWTESSERIHCCYSIWWCAEKSYWSHYHARRENEQPGRPVQ